MQKKYPDYVNPYLFGADIWFWIVLGINIALLMTFVIYYKRVRLKYILILLFSWICVALVGWSMPGQIGLLVFIPYAFLVFIAFVPLATNMSVTHP